MKTGEVSSARRDLRDLLEVGLINQIWPDKLPAALAERLRVNLDDPFGQGISR